MKQLFLILSVALLFLSSCKSVKFEIPQPKETDALIEFPDNLIGTYQNNNKEKLVISKKTITYGNKDSKIIYISKTLLPDETVLKKCGDYYVLSLKYENYWELILFKTIDKDLKVYYIDLDKNEENIINNLKEITIVKEIRNNEEKIDYYLINPSKKEFDILLKKEIFSKIVDFNRIM